MVPEALAAADGSRSSASAPTSSASPAPTCSSAPSRAAGAQAGADWILDQAFPRERAPPMVTVLDGHPHTLAFLAGSTRCEPRTWA